jgi:hypothetical protein
LPLGIDGECRADGCLGYDVVLDATIKRSHIRHRPSLGRS